VLCAAEVISHFRARPETPLDAGGGSRAALAERAQIDVQRRHRHA
jgi:hypothetical protein